MTRLDDIRELKRELSSEIVMLQQAVEEKKQRDQRAIDRLSQRIELLQGDLGRAEEKASLDPLTRVANRDSLDRTLGRLMDASRAAGTPLSLAMIDIDHFKQINDTYGHQLGDRVLLCVAEALRAAVRPTDIVARYGGDELVVVLPGMPLHHAADRFDGILRAVAGRSYEYEQGGKPGAIRFTASCGVSQLAAGDTDKDLIHRADQALYDAKRKGRNRVIARKHSRLARLLSR